MIQACVGGDTADVSALLTQGADANSICSVTNSTPLLEAVKNVGLPGGDHAAVVQLLLQASADPDRVPGSGPTGEPPGDSALQHAAAEGYLPIVNLLLEAGADVNACANLPEDDDDFYDQPPLSFACENAHPEVVAALLRHNADVNKRSTENRTPLELAAGSENAPEEALVVVVRQLIQAGAPLDSFDDEEESPLMRAAMAGHVQIIRELLAAGADPDWFKASNGETPLYVACSEGHSACVEELAIHSSQLNVRKIPTNETALYVACSKGHLEVVKTLIKAGVDTSERQNTVPRTGYYPLYIAASNGHADIVEELHMAGCSISTLTTNKDTPLIIAAYNGYAKVIEVLSAAKADVHYTKSGSGETALYYACLQGRLAAVKALLAADSRHSDALFDNQETPLHCCAMGGHAQVVTELLKAGAKHGATKSDGATPLYSACHGGKLEAHDGQLHAVKELLRAGADPNASRPMDQGGDSCLIIAAFHQRTRMVEELLKAGADVEYANTDGMCALGWAVKKNVTAMVQALIEHGANPEFYNTAATSTPLIKAAMTSVSEAEAKAQQQAQEIVSILLDAGASLNQSVAVARKHVPKAVKALQVVKMRRRRSSKTKGGHKDKTRSAEQLEEAELRAQQAMQELLAEEDLAQQQASKKGKKKNHAHSQQVTQQSKKLEKSKSQIKQSASEPRALNHATQVVHSQAETNDDVPKIWSKLLEDADTDLDAELRLLGSPVAAASEVGEDSAASPAAPTVESSDYLEAYLFVCTNETEEECFRRELLGDKECMMDSVRRIGPCTRLYMLNVTSRVLFGEFRCVQNGINLVPEAWVASKSRGRKTKQSTLPAQVRITSKVGPSLGRAGLKVPSRVIPQSSGPLGEEDLQAILVSVTAASGKIYPSLSTTSAGNGSAVDLPALALPAVEVFRRRAIDSTIQAMVKLFDGMCPERWQRMKPFTKRKFCQDLHSKCMLREAAWHNSRRGASNGNGLGPSVYDGRSDPMLPSKAVTRSNTLRQYALQQLKAEPYHLVESSVKGVLLTLAELFARVCQRVAQFSQRCKQSLQYSRAKAVQRRGRSSRNPVWTDAVFGVSLVEDRRPSRGSGTSTQARSVIRLTWNDTQYPELGQETVELWQDCYDELIKRHLSNGHAAELGRARTFTLVLRHETASETRLGSQLSLPQTVFDTLKSQYSVQHECYASPLNNACPTFGSVFPDTDVFFGSRGSFYDFEPSSGSFVVHTPADLQSMHDACDHIVQLLTNGEGPLSFCLVMPADRLVAITDLVDADNASLVRQCTVLPRGQHCFIAGLHHRPMDRGKTDNEQARLVMDKGDSQLYWLQNDHGAEMWDVSAGATVALLDSFREQPTGAVAAPASAKSHHAVITSAIAPAGSGGGVEVHTRGAHAAVTHITSREGTGGVDSPPAIATASSGIAHSTAVQENQVGQREPGRVPDDDLSSEATAGIEEMMEAAGGSLVVRYNPVGAHAGGGQFIPDKQLLAWIDGLGLAKYASLFVQAEVDMAAACLLSDTDLVEIGVRQLGVRKKLLHAIALLPPETCSLFASLH